MTDAVVASHKASITNRLAYLYRDAALVTPGAKTSDGRGGYTSAASTEIAIQAQRESSHNALAMRNISSERALIFVLATTGVEPVKGLSIRLDGKLYVIHGVKSDPVGAVFECECTHDD